jgi:hypothetical protein
MTFRLQVGKMDGLQSRLTRCPQNALDQARRRLTSQQARLARKLEPPDGAFLPPGGGGNKPGNRLSFLGDNEM